MANIIRNGLNQILFNTTKNKPIINSKIINPSLQFICNISGKTIRGEASLNKPKPFPYKEKNYGFLQACFDKTTKRLDENSKIVVVDGPLAAGKSAFAIELAKELEMLYIPETTLDKYYINPYGFDMRKLDPQLPEYVKSFDVKNFLQNPHHRNVATFQLRMLILRYSDYVDALAHLLSTGQGVVLDRCVYSDFVFLETMFKHNYISKGARSVYYDLVKHTFSEILRPHLVIYLDVPVNIVKERLKKRADPIEANSKVLTDAYLQDMETIYKQQYLKDISTHAELLIYDWSNYGESEVVVEDIERIDFDRFDKFDTKMKDWLLNTEWEWNEMRMRFTSEKPDLINYFNIPRFDVPELIISPEDSKIWEEVWFSAPGMNYKLGYNVDMGDTGILTKTKQAARDSL
uniref:NADH dehydrogenase [ubiquinone] 1 alpha subcomplex subunit 10, mitochondrial n=1 Tax=Corethrella appendiculata TaxID=1370023 RepID=U5EVK8_9DIPT